MSGLLHCKFRTAVFIISLGLPAILLAQTVAEKSFEDQLFEKLLTATQSEGQKIERQLLSLWSDSGNSDWNLRLEWAKQRMFSKDLANAIEQLSKLSEIAPDFAEVWNTRATAWYLLGDYDSSLKDISKTLKLNPRHFGALFGLAIILEKYEQNESALIVYEDIADIHPTRKGLAEAIERLRKELYGEIL